jgi:hypothetical protein
MYNDGPKGPWMDIVDWCRARGMVYVEEQLGVGAVHCGNRAACLCLAPPDRQEVKVFLHFSFFFSFL